MIASLSGPNLNIRGLIFEIFGPHSQSISIGYTGPQNGYFWSLPEIENLARSQYAICFLRGREHCNGTQVSQPLDFGHPDILKHVTEPAPQLE